MQTPPGWPTDWPPQASRAKGRRSQGLGPIPVLVAGLFLAILMGWQAWQGFQLLRLQHHAQVEESVWLIADQLALNLDVKSRALAHVLDSLGAQPDDPVLSELLPGLRHIQPVDVPASALGLPRESWSQLIWRLHLSGQAFALDSDPRQRALYWAVPGREHGRYWLLTLDDRVLSRLVSAQAAHSYSWLLEDAGHARVMARQQRDRLVFLDNAPLSSIEREQVLVSAPVAGTLWQVRGLVEPEYYRGQLGRMVTYKLLLFAAFVLGLILVLWVLTRMQRLNRRLDADSKASLQHMQISERRYRDIFQGVGMALCLLDLSTLRVFLRDRRIDSQQALDQWLEANPERHQELLATIRILDANQVTLDLLALQAVEELDTLFHQDQSLRAGGARYQLVLAVIQGKTRMELETPLRTRRGTLRWLWVVMCLPEQVEDYRAVTLSMTDVTTRRRVEASMIEREQFWAQVVRSVPDVVFIKDVQRNRFVFTNRSLMRQLGYSREEEQALPAYQRDRLLHPDDLEYMQACRNQLQVLSADQMLEWRVRWRHRHGDWRWFLLQAKLLAHDPQGRVRQVIGTAKDITQQTLANQRLQTSEQRYRLLAENISDVIWSTDAEFRLDYISPSVVAVLGYSPGELLSRGFDDIVVGPQFRQFMDALLDELRPLVHQADGAQQLREQGFQRQISFDCLRLDGSKCPVELRVSLMWSQQGRFLGLLGIARDISEQRRTENRLRLAATVFENTTGAIVVTDPVGYIVQVNENFSQITGYLADEVIDQTPQLFSSPVHGESFYPDILRTLRQQGRWEGELWQRRKSGEDFPSWAGINAVYDHEGDLVSYVCFFVDISERKANEARIESLAYYDALTGLPNRTLFQDRLGNALQQAQRRNEWLAVMFLDLDRFKPINDTLGHAAGDALLREVARRLCDCVRDSDTVARMGGDEFTVLLVGLKSRDSAMAASVHVAEKVLASLAPAFVLQEREFFISASIGIALCPQDGQEASALLKFADTAMYHAKSTGKATFQFYQNEMNSQALERLSLEAELRRALQEDSLSLHFQPQFDCASLQLSGAEVLLRWQHPRLGAVPPSVFVPIAEEIGLVGNLGEWVLDRACQQWAQWRDAGLHLPRLGVNVSAQQFAGGQVVGQVRAVLERYALDPAVLELELTESVLLRDVEDTMQALAGLKALGVGIAVDDFGTGYSSLSYLKEFPIDTLKIDRGFIQAMAADSRDARLSQAIIAMARSLHLRVVAEGVESDEQLQLLRGFGCDEVQGYLLGHPVPAQLLHDDFLCQAKEEN